MKTSEYDVIDYTKHYSNQIIYNHLITNYPLEIKIILKKSLDLNK
jgi:hypothetical protein